MTRRALLTSIALRVLFALAGSAHADGFPLTRADYVEDLRGRVASAAAQGGDGTCDTDSACQARVVSFGLDPALWDAGEEEIAEMCAEGDDAACDWQEAVFMSAEQVRRHAAHRDACRATPDHDDCAAFQR